MKSIFILLFCLVCSLAFCQYDFDELYLPFAIPDFPAFKVLNIDESQALHPSSSKEFATSLSKYFAGKKSYIPESYATEFTPYFLVFPKATFRDYDKAHEKILGVRCDTKMSIATSKDSNGIYNGAIGLRYAFIDKSDLKRNKVEREKIMSVLEIRHQAYSAFQKDFEQKRGLPEGSLDEHTALQDTMKVMFTASYPTVKEQLKLTQKERADEAWNKTKCEVALALVGCSPDSMAIHIKYQAVQLWFVYAQGFSPNCMGLFNISGKLYKDGDTYSAVYIPAKVLYGSNFTKGSLELQYSYENENLVNKIIGNIGLTQRVVPGIWADLSLGIIRDTTNNISKIQSGLNMKFGE